MENRGGTGKRTDDKTQPKTPDSLRREASQAARAAPTLRYGPAGDSASLQIGPQQSRARSGEAYP